MMESQISDVLLDSEKLPEISEPSETEANVSSSSLKSFEANEPPPETTPTTPTTPSSSSSTSSTKPASKNKVSRKKSKKKILEDTEISSPSPKPPDLSEPHDSLDISDSPAASDISDLCCSSLGHSANSQSANSSSGHLDSPDMPRKYDKPVHVVSKFEEIICLICENNLKICGSSYTHIFKGQKRGGPLQGLPERISAFIGASDELKPNDVGSYYMCAQCQRNLQKGELLEKQVNQIREMFTSSFTATSVNHRLKKRRINLSPQPQTSVEVKQLQIRIKELEQERHALRLRLESLEAEYENTVKELQDDVSQLRQELHEQQQQLTAGDKDKVNMIRELTQQNERLTDQVQKAAEMEGQLVSEVQGLRTQASMRTSMHDHIDQLEALHAKINELNEKKSDLDKRIGILTEERDSYACSLEESQDRILMLEKQKFDQEQQIRSQGREIYELQEVNHQLQVQIENLSQRSSYSSTGPPSQTLFNELSSASVDSEKDTAAGTTQSMMMMDMAFEDDIECDDECAQVPLAHSTMTSDALQTPRSHLLEELQKEILEVYNQLRKLCGKIRSQPSHQRNSHSVAGSGGASIENAFDEEQQQICNSFDDLLPGQLTSVLQELQQLIHNQLHPSKYKESGMASGGDQTDSEDVGKVTLMAEQIHDLHVELSGVRTHVAGLHADLQLREQQLQQKNTEISQLNSKIEEQQQELQKLRSERDRLQDQSMGVLTRDEVLEQTRHDRNNAIEMKIQCEKELSQAQGEIMSLNNQLMAAIHQKVMVSQQRDQWQTDMEELIDIQMRKRLHQEKIKEQVEEQLKEHKVKRSGSFFSRVKH